MSRSVEFLFKEMRRENTQRKVDVIRSLLKEWEKDGLTQNDFLRDIDSAIIEKLKNVTVSQETIQDCADRSKELSQEEELLSEMLEKATDAGATVNAMITEDSSALDDLGMNTRAHQLLEEILQKLLEKCCGGEDMFGDETLNENIDDLSEDIDAVKREVAFLKDLCRDRETALGDNSEQGGDRAPFLRNELRMLEEQSVELNEILLAKEKENSEIDKELQNFMQ